MSTIKEIYRLNFMNSDWSYVGLLRNQKKFNLHDNVFFVIRGNEIARGTIVGVELPPVMNPEYTYKVSLPAELVRQEMVRLGMDTNDFYEGNNFDRVTLTCDHIFSTIEEAKKSATKQLEKMYELQKQEIERYFKQFE